MPAARPHKDVCCADACRQNEGLEQDALLMQAKQLRLQQEATALSERLQAVLKDRCERRVGFDAETPIDKTLNYLQGIITVRPFMLHAA